MAELAETNTAGHIHGKDIEGFAICQECEALLHTGKEVDNRKFWDEGWESLK